ncbi:MAG TPA: glycosyltransferase [Candidatus Paceibacterota bacterium]|nr:glycosyltransferase [Candidatus Paceibacterota bacterium]
MSIRFGFVSTYPPTHCGIATFSNSLMSAIRDLGRHTTSVVRLVDKGANEPERSVSPEILRTLHAGNSESLASAVAALNAMDIAVIQHEFGIYGGVDGDEVLDILKGLRIPSIVVVHTVLITPTWHQRIVFTQLTKSASAVVTMSNTARDLLVSKYCVEPSKIFVLPHGAPAFPDVMAEDLASRPLILTWGLIGPGKGIEWGIDAMDRLRDLEPAPRYLVAGRTHPKVLENEGEAYRESLRRRIGKLNLTDVVELNADYLSDGELAVLVASASVVLLPYDSTEQMTSGVLIEAVTAGRPVVATNFPHAIELLGDDVGIVVPHHDPDAIAQALRVIIQDPAAATAFSQRAKEIGAELLWPSVAARYVKLARALIRAEAAA